jgi:hypothetical protein
VGRASTGHIRLRLPFEARAALALHSARGRLAGALACAGQRLSPPRLMRCAAYGLHTQAYTPPPPDPAVVHANFFAGAARGFEQAALRLPSGATGGAELLLALRADGDSLL